MLSQTAPEYTGVCFVEAHFANVDTDHPAVTELIGDGHLFACGDYRGLIAQRNSNSRVGVFIGIRDEPDWCRACLRMCEILTLRWN